MFSWLHQTLFPYAMEIPIPIFVFFASLVEEIIPPIPAFPVMLMAGTFAKLQDYHLLTLPLLALVSALGKTIGAIAVYKVMNRLEKTFFARFGNILKIQAEDLEKFGKRLGNGLLDYLILISLRSFPLVPSTLISISSGLLKIPLRLFVITTFVGTIFRDGLYLYLGFMGTGIFRKHIAGHEHLLLTLKLIALFLVIAYFVYLYLAYRKNANDKALMKSALSD